MDRTRTPVIVGVGQVTNRIRRVETDARPAHELIIEAVRTAAADTGAAGVLGALDQLTAVFCIGWYYPDLAREVAGGLGITPRHLVNTVVGGNTPQKIVNDAARCIARGEREAVLLCGGEAVASRRKAHRAGYGLPWPKIEPPESRSHDLLAGCDPYEFQSGLFMPAHLFPMYENGLRAHAGESIAEHQVKVSELCAAFSAVAATHPNAWFQQARSAEEIRTVTEVNRMVGFPYPKYMNSLPEVDMAAAVIVCSVAKAEALGISEDRWVYLHGCADYHDSEALGERVNFHSSPVARVCGAQAYAQAGIGPGDVQYVDLYSCFPCVPQIAARELGFTDRPWGDLTVTGGLPYFGGPWNNYSMHAIATMTDRLRADRDARGLVFAIGMWITKQSVGIYGGRPKPDGFALRDTAPYEAELAALPRPRYTHEPAGGATVESYSVVHARSGEPEKGFVFVRLADDVRGLAVVEDPAMLMWMETHEGVGARGRVQPCDGGPARFTLTAG